MRNRIVRNVQSASENPYDLMEVSGTSIMMLTNVTELTHTTGLVRITLKRLMSCLPLSP